MLSPLRQFRPVHVGGLWWVLPALGRASTLTRSGRVRGTPWCRDTNAGACSPHTRPGSSSRWRERTGGTSRTRPSPGSASSIPAHSSPPGQPSSDRWRSFSTPERPCLCPVSLLYIHKALYFVTLRKIKDHLTLILYSYTCENVYATTAHVESHNAVDWFDFVSQRLKS